MAVYPFIRTLPETNIYMVHIYIYIQWFIIYQPSGRDVGRFETNNICTHLLYPQNQWLEDEFSVGARPISLLEMLNSR